MDWKSNIIKITILPKAIYRFSAIYIKLPMTFFHRTRTKTSQNLCGNTKDLENEKWGWRNQASWPQTILKAAVIKTVWYWHKSRNFRSMEQDRKPRNKPMSLRSINLWQRREVYTMLERQVSSTNGPGKNEQPHVKNEIRSFFNSIVKISSRWIKDLNVSVDTIKL